MGRGCGEPKRVIEDASSAVRPYYWRDPETDEDRIVFIDAYGRFRYPTHKQRASTFIHTPSTGETETLYDYPCPSGRSPDGKRLASAFTSVVLVDLEEGEPVYVKQPGCCASVCPDESYRLIYNTSSHRSLLIYDAEGNTIKRIQAPPGAHYVMTPRWSNHTAIITYVAQFSANGSDYEKGKPYRYFIVVHNIETDERVILKSLPGSWYGPHLWLPLSEQAQASD
jgi:hypothetical protein